MSAETTPTAQHKDGGKRITRISLPLPLRMGTVNCYLLEATTGYVLIDTGSSGRMVALEQALAESGCRAGDLRLIILTHGDFDHVGNAAHLRDRYGAAIGMHRDDVGMVERRDMFWNRRKGNVILRAIAPVLFGFGKSRRFVPDVLVEEGTDLTPYGLAARVVHLPGHSSGSIGVLTAAGDLLCGDLLANSGTPALNDIMDNPETAEASVQRLRGMDIGTVYPGHGEPFRMSEFGEAKR